MDIWGWKDFGKHLSFSLRPNWALQGQISPIPKFSRLSGKDDSVIYVL